MKCLMAGVFNERSTNVSQAEALERQGCGVYRYNYREVADNIGGERRDKHLIQLAKERMPDFVLFCKCNGVSIDVVRKVKLAAKTVLWYPDPCNSNWNRELLEKVRECDLVFCALWNPAEKAKGWNTNSYYLHEGFDPLVDKPMKVIDGQWPVTFIGNPDAHRREFLDSIRCYQPEAWGLDHARLVCESVINLNFVRNNDGCSDRVYKILAAGGFLLTEAWPKMENDFEDGKDLVTFANLVDLKEKIAYYLENDKERKSIAEQGYKTVQKYSRDNWAKRVIEEVQRHAA